jgi:hypothetical protein
LQGFLTVQRLEARTIRKIDAENGLQLHTYSGRAYGSIGYGGSLIGSLAGYPSATAVSVKLQSWHDQSRPDGYDRTQPARPTVRQDLLKVTFSSLVLVEAVTTILYQLR